MTPEQLKAEQMAGDKTLLIKGTVKDALLSANLHGVRLSVMSRVCKCHEEIAAVTSASAEELNKWFTEDLGKGPFPPGSLLFWAPAGQAQEQLESLQAAGRQES